MSRVSKALRAVAWRKLGTIVWVVWGLSIHNKKLNLGFNTGVKGDIRWLLTHPICIGKPVEICLKLVQNLWVFPSRDMSHTIFFWWIKNSIAKFPVKMRNIGWFGGPPGSLDRKWGHAAGYHSSGLLGTGWTNGCGDPIKRRSLFCISTIFF